MLSSEYLAHAEHREWQRQFNLRAARGEFILHELPASERRNWFSDRLRGLAEILKQQRMETSHP